MNDLMTNVNQMSLCMQLISFLGCISDFKFIRKGFFNVSDRYRYRVTDNNVRDICACASESRNNHSSVAYDFNNDTKECVLYTKLGDIKEDDDRRAYIKDNKTCPANTQCKS